MSKRKKEKRINKCNENIYGIAKEENDSTFIFTRMRRQPGHKTKSALRHQIIGFHRICFRCAQTFTQKTKIVSDFDESGGKKGIAFINNNNNQKRRKYWQS